MPCNKSSSSSTSLPSNPNPRSSEINEPMRRSFKGNPLAKPSIIANPRTIFPNTPANSPSDFPRRNSVGCRESVGSLRDLDDKENGKDQILKPAKVRSPAASSKSTKNFMSPTISASCKITESPRKKVLIERNEPEAAPTSIPSTDAKTHTREVTFTEPLECGDLKPDVGVDEKKLDDLFDGIPNFEDIHSSSLTSEDLSDDETVHDDANVPLIPKNDTELSFETVHDIDMDVPLILENGIDTEPSFETVVEEPDCVNLDPTFRLSPTPPPVSSTTTILAPLDADPLMPPYDPNTNYLSPRPQFLHYKPKPRMELCNEREFEDSFISGSFSASEQVTEDTQSEGSLKESEDVSSDEIVKEEVGRISEPSPDRRTFMPHENVDAKEVPKPRFFMRSMAIALVLLLSVAFISISVINSPVIDHTVFEDFYEVYESSEFSDFARANFDQFSQFAKANVDGLARNFHIWFTKSLSSISALISNVRGVHNLAQLQYCNLTALHDYIVVNQYPIFGRAENEIGGTPEVHPPVLIVQEIDAASKIGTNEDIEEISAEHYEVYEEQVQQDINAVENALDAPEYEEVLEGQPAVMIESEQALKLVEIGNLEVKQAQEDDANFNVENASDALDSEEVLKGQPVTMVESEQALLLAEAGNSEAKQAQDDDANFNAENQPGLNSEAIEVYEAGNVDSRQAQENDAKFNVDKESNVGLKHWPGLDSEVAEIHTEVYDVKAEGKSVSIDAAIRGNEQRLEAIDIPPRMVLYLLLCGGTILIASAAFNWSRKGKSRSKRVTSSVEQPLFGKELHTNSLLAPNKQISPDKPSLRNGPTEMDVLGEPCSSEMSSFQKSSSYCSKKVVKRLNEANSLEKKRKNNYRREESLASSSEDYSMGSPSYGSLTVYQKIPSKQGHGDEETITPVRRSSRIRNLATSPL